MANELGFAAMLFSWLGVWLIGSRNAEGWWVALIGDVLWFLACWQTGIVSFIINDCVFIFLRLRGWWQWRQHEQRD